jgi:hypothetical protein
LNWIPALVSNGIIVMFLINQTSIKVLFSPFIKQKSR